jgi:membrane protein
MYYRFPDTEVGMYDILPGVVSAAVGWAALQGLFQVYLAFKDPGSGGFFGSVVLVVTYLYFSGLVLLLGAVINAVIGGHSSGEPGGVGRGATSYDTEREETLDRDELADYLDGLRSELAGRYDGMASDNDADRPRRPRSEGDVELVEHRTEDGDERRWAITLRWDVPEDSEEFGSSAESERSAELGKPDRSERPADD